MSGFLKSSVDMLVGRTTGPLTLRLILQPAMASFLAIRAGLKDAREGRTPYLWTLAGAPSKQRHLIRDGWRQIRMVFTVAFVLDVVYEIMVFRWVYIGQALIVAVCLAMIPYLCVRGMTTRFASKFQRQPPVAS